MNLRTPFAIAAISILVAPLAIGGDLNPPPGPIQPTNRVQLNQNNVTLPYTITQPGSYVLTSNLLGVLGERGIIIAADNVTLDLNGFALIGASVAGSGISSNSAFDNVRITNGTLRSWDFAIDLVGNNNQIDHLRVMENADGIVTQGPATISHCTAYLNTFHGIDLGAGGTMSDCVARDNGSVGIFASAAATIINCSSYNNGFRGIWAGSSSTIQNCTSRDNAGIGIEVGDGSVVVACTVYSNDDHGIEASTGCAITDCNVSTNNGDGILVASDCLVARNNVTTHTGAGIHAFGGNANRIDSNNSTRCAIGIHAENSGNIILRNTASKNGIDYFFVPGNSYAQIINVAGIGSFGSTDPWANFSY